MSGDDFDVVGGTNGVAARYEDMLTLARHSDDFAADLAVISAQCHAALADPNVLASAVLNPAGVAKFEAMLFHALDGPAGLTALSVGYEARSVSLRTLVGSYQAGDAMSAWTLDQVRWLLGYVALPVAGATVAGPLLTLGPLLGSAVVATQLAGLGLAATAFTRDGGWEQLLYDHPGIIDTAVGMAPGLITFLPGTPVVRDVPQAARLLGLLWPDGDPRIVGMTNDAGLETAPEDLGDLLEALHQRNVEADPYEPAQIDVREVTHPDGTRAYIVDIPGTKVWNPPWQDNEFLNNLGSNVHLTGGQTSALERGIALALENAGVGPDDPVMLVGHSQGGLVAAQAAHDSATGAFNYNVTHVVTAGAPIGNTPIPADVQVLAMENYHDLVPRLDATDNPDQPNVTTVSFDSDSGTIAGSHHTDTYLAAAEKLDESTDPSVVAFKESAHQFLSGGNSVDTWLYELTRDY